MRRATVDNHLSTRCRAAAAPLLGAFCNVIHNAGAVGDISLSTVREVREAPLGVRLVPVAIEAGYLHLQMVGMPHGD